MLTTNYSMYAMTIPKPMTLRYNPYTQSVEVLNDRHQIFQLVRDLTSE